MTLYDNESYPGHEDLHARQRLQHPGPAAPGSRRHGLIELPLPAGLRADHLVRPLHWCATLTIDSLLASCGGLHETGSPPNALANPNCAEPVNFAFLTHSTGRSALPA